MSDYVDYEKQDAPTDAELANIDWDQLRKDVMSVQFDDSGWSACDQGAEALPGDR